MSKCDTPNKDPHPFIWTKDVGEEGGKTTFKGNKPWAKMWPMFCYPNMTCVSLPEALPNQPIIIIHNPCFSAVLKKACIPNSALWPEASRRATPTCRGPLPQHGAACQHRGLTALMVLVLKSVAWPSGGRCQRRHHTTPVFCWQTFAISKSQEYTRSYKIDKIWQPYFALWGLERFSTASDKTVAQSLQWGCIKSRRFKLIL